MARGPHPGLEKEAKRVIGMLPKMKPGRQRGKAVVMPFSIPIVFQVQD
jgi:protein TonB